MFVEKHDLEFHTMLKLTEFVVNSDNYYEDFNLLKFNILKYRYLTLFKIVFIIFRKPPNQIILLMEKLQWDLFTKKIYIHSPIQKLYDLWATTAGITSWFLKNAEYKSLEGVIRKPSEYIQKGDTYVWQWYNWDGKEEGEVISANGKDYIEISFESSKVSIKLEQKNNVTIVVLRQFDIPVDEESKLKVYYGCSNGWTFWLANLKAFVEHGVLLNETEINLKENELAGYEFVNM